MVYQIITIQIHLNIRTLKIFWPELKAKEYKFYLIMHEHLLFSENQKKMKTFQELRGQLKNNRARDPEINSGLK